MARRDPGKFAGDSNAKLALWAEAFDEFKKTGVKPVPWPPA